MGFDVIWWLIVVAIIFTLVRPGSPAATAIAAIGELTAGLIGVATGAAFKPS